MKYLTQAALISLCFLFAGGFSSLTAQNEIPDTGEPAPEISGDITRGSNPFQISQYLDRGWNVALTVYVREQTPV